MPPTLLFLGDLDERHGVDLLLRAMPAILRHHPQARLVVVGDGPLAEPLAAYCRYLQLEDAVTFLPASAAPPDADVVVVPGREGVGLRAIEAARSARKPVVATHEAAAGGAEHEADALLVYPSENAIAAAVVRLLNDPELARKLGEAGHRRWLDPFSEIAPFPPGRDAPESRS